MLHRHLLPLASLLIACGSKPAAVPSTSPGPQPPGAEERLPPTLPSSSGESPPPLPQNAIGTDAPTVVIDASPNGAWVALCQARTDTDHNGRIEVLLGPHGELTGDRLEPFLVEGSGPGTAIEQLVGRDPTGRHLGLIRGGELWLRDTATGQEQSLSRLGADPSNDRASFLPHRALSFDPLGRYVSYIRVQGERTWVVVRELGNGAETLVDPGPFKLWRMHFEPGGEFLRLSIVEDDTNRNGRLGWGAGPADPAATGCPGPIESFTVEGLEPDKATEHLYHLRSGRLIRVEGFVATNGSSYISRSDTGALWQHGLDGATRAVSSEKCSGKVLHVDDASGSVLLGCASNYGGRRDLYLRTETRRIALGLDIAPYETDGRLPDAPALTIVNPRNEAYLLDVRSGALQKLPELTNQVRTYQSTILAFRDGALLWLNEQAVERAVGRPRPTLAPILQTGAWCALGHEVYDLAARSYAGRYPIAPLAVALDGSGLLPAAVEILPRGPLSWHAPQQPPTFPVRATARR